jgi:hypothetical protein
LGAVEEPFLIFALCKHLSQVDQLPDFPSGISRHGIHGFADRPIDCLPDQPVTQFQDFSLPVFSFCKLFDTAFPASFCSSCLGGKPALHNHKRNCYNKYILVDHGETLYWQIGACVRFSYTGTDLSGDRQKMPCCYKLDSGGKASSSKKPWGTAVLKH